MNDDRGFLETLLADGRTLINLTALMIMGCGAFAIFQACSGGFLPQDVAYLGMTSDQLCSLQGCRILHFMVHDRVSFGGVMITVAIIYLWLSEFPLRNREPWAWWALAVSGIGGFLSFLAYLGYGYLDTWHGVATLALLPLYLGGMWRTRDVCRAGRVTFPPLDFKSREGLGRVLLILATFGICMGGLTIMAVGMTRVFVPQDLEFIGMDAARIGAINDHLVPLIAHDRAGFGGSLFSAGLAMFFCAAFARPSKSLREALLLAGVAGFTTAIGVHPVIGYINATHLGPAVFGCLAYFTGLAMTVPSRQKTWSAAVMPPPSAS
jgi:hypothetical protein